MPWGEVELAVAVAVAAPLADVVALRSEPLDSAVATLRGRKCFDERRPSTCTAVWGCPPERHPDARAAGCLAIDRSPREGTVQQDGRNGSGCPRKAPQPQRPPGESGRCVVPKDIAGAGFVLRRTQTSPRRPPPEAAVRGGYTPGSHAYFLTTVTFFLAILVPALAEVALMLSFTLPSCLNRILSA